MPKGEPPKGGKSHSDMRKYVIAGSALLVVVLLIAAIFAVNGGGEAIEASVTGEESQAIQPGDVPGSDEPSGTQTERTAATNYLIEKGYQVGQFSFTVEKPMNTDRGAASVSEEPVCTVAKLKRWIQSGSERAKAYLQYAKENLPEVDYDRVRRGEGFVRVQLLVPSEYTKNSYFTEGRVVATTADRSVEAGDIVFLYTSKPVERKLENGRTEPVSEVREMGNTRCQCGNGGAVPVPVSGPPAPPVTVPPPGITRHPPTEKEVPGKPQVPIWSFDDPHSAGHGADLPPKSESDYQGPPPRHVPANPPVVTPPGTGGKIPPGSSPPQNDSAGGTVTQPTAPPTPQPSLPPSTSPPPPPEQGAPPPPG
ncbi:MAG: hypothetical protein Q8Q11_03675 [bacterium]|nr:hypothetical protein [bacterium]